MAIVSYNVYDIGTTTAKVAFSAAVGVVQPSSTTLEDLIPGQFNNRSVTVVVVTEAGSEVVQLNIPVYTKPERFYWKTNNSELIPTQDIITTVITASRVDDYINALNALLSWRIQAPDTTANQYRVRRNDIITAAWYNNVARLQQNVSFVSAGALVTAATFNALGNW